MMHPGSRTKVSFHSFSHGIVILSAAPHTFIA